MFIKSALFRGFRGSNISEETRKYPNIRSSGFEQGQVYFFKAWGIFEPYSKIFCRTGTRRISNSQDNLDSLFQTNNFCCNIKNAISSLLHPPSVYENNFRKLFLSKPPIAFLQSGLPKISSVCFRAGKVGWTANQKIRSSLS